MFLQASSQVLQAGATEEKGETARMVSVLSGFVLYGVYADRRAHEEKLITLRPSLQAAFIGAMAIADLVKTTLGPKGMVSTAFFLYHGHD